MSKARIYGAVPGVSPGKHFGSRIELMTAGVHGLGQAGIHGDPEQGAFSICISKGYEDNKDEGNTIIYVGSGGQTNKEQTEDQTFEDSGNKSLLVSSQTRRPVRVIRGPNDSSYYSPKSGYRYDGLYVVDSAEMRPGKKGFQMCFFTLRKIEGDDYRVPVRRALTLKKMANMRRKAKGN